MIPKFTLALLTLIGACSRADTTPAPAPVRSTWVQPAATGNKQAAKVAVVGTNPLNVGIVDPEALITGKFKLLNQSDKPLTISSIFAGCRCTYAETDTNVILPNQVIELRFEIDFRGTVGELKKPIDVFFVGYDNPARCSVIGQMQYPVRVEAPYVAHPDAVTQKAQFTLKAGDGVPFSILSVNGEPPHVVASEPANVEKAISWTLQVDARKSTPAMYVIETTHPKTPVLEVKNYDSKASNIELPYLKTMNDVAIGRKGCNVGNLTKDKPYEFETTFYRKDGSKEVTVSGESEDVKFELIGTFPARRPDEVGLRIRVTKTSDKVGYLLTPVYIANGDIKTRMWVDGLLK